MKQKRVKLTAGQQVVINLMAQGYALEATEFSLGEWTECLIKGDERVTVRVGTGRALRKKKVVDCTQKGNTNFRLTPLGRSLAKKVTPPKVETWYGVDSCGRVDTLEVVKVTKTYFISASGRRWKKDGILSWFKTVDEAIQYQQDKLKSAVIDAEVSLKHCKHKLAEFLHATKGDCGSSGMSDPMEQARTEVSRLVGPYMAKEAHRLYTAACEQALAQVTAERDEARRMVGTAQDAAVKAIGELAQARTRITELEASAAHCAEQAGPDSCAAMQS